jgi:uncharacterized membrane protein YidH (DUF202 family)
VVIQEVSTATSDYLSFQIDHVATAVISEQCSVVIAMQGLLTVKIATVEFYQNKTLLQIYFLLVYIVFSKIKYFI